MTESFLPVSRSRRAFLKRLALAFPVLALGGVGGVGGTFLYSNRIERHRLRVDRHDVKLSLGPKAPARFRAVSLTDFHFDPLFEVDYLAEVVRRTNELQPDLILLTGDYISSTSRRFEDFGKIMSGFRPKAATLACLGNHDHWNQPGRIHSILARQGIDVLVNQHSRVPVAGGEVIVTGLQSAWGGFPDFITAARGLSAKDRTLVLMHEPDFATMLAWDERAAFQTSGHTHGGQVRLPLLGALRLPSWGKKFQAGFYQLRDLALYVNRGIGTIEHHVRFLCPPEIACFDIVNKDAV